MKLKKIVAFSLTFFILAAISIITLGLFSKNQESNPPVKFEATPTINIIPSIQKTTGGITLSLQEIALHNSVSDCWLIINNNIYNVTSELDQHPGGVETISPYCGKEATNAFVTKDRGANDNHSSRAYSQLANLLLGQLNQKLK